MSLAGRDGSGRGGPYGGDFAAPSKTLRNGKIVRQLFAYARSAVGRCRRPLSWCGGRGVKLAALVVAGGLLWLGGTTGGGAWAQETAAPSAGAETLTASEPSAATPATPAAASEPAAAPQTPATAADPAAVPAPVPAAAQTAHAAQVVAAAVRGEVRSLYAEIETLRDTVQALQSEVRGLRAELAAQRQAKPEPGFFRRHWERLKEQVGKIWR